MANGNFISAGSLLPKILASRQLDVTTPITVYTVPANTGARIEQGSLCNTSGSATILVSLSVVPSGGTDDVTHRVLNQYSMSAGATVHLWESLAGTMLGPGDFISLIASVANAVDIVLTGAESV